MFLDGSLVTVDDHRMRSKIVKVRKIIMVDFVVVVDDRKSQTDKPGEQESKCLSPAFRR
jgi:hypothetical protein